MLRESSKKELISCLKRASLEVMTQWYFKELCGLLPYILVSGLTTTQENCAGVDAGVDVGLEFVPVKGKEYLVWYCERGAKTRTGKENEQKRMFNPQVYATSGNRCPVLYNIFKQHRPNESLTLHSFLHSWHPADMQWYFNSPY